MEQEFTLQHACRRVQCTKHEQPISLICIAEKCDTDRLFCLECFDGQTPGDHVMINVKKFSSLYENFKSVGNDGCIKKIQTDFAEFRNNVNKMIDYLEKCAVASSNGSINLANGEEQEIRGKLVDIVRKPIWAQVIRGKKEGKTEAEIGQIIKKNDEGQSNKLFNTLEVIRKNVCFKLKDGLQILGNVEPAENGKRFFSNLQRCPTIQLFSNRKIAKNTIDDGHYFVVAEDPFTRQDFKRDFILKSYGPDGTASLWVGLTNPQISKKSNFVNIYDQGKGSHFIVFYDAGASINTWNQALANCSKSYNLENCKEGCRVRIEINYKRNVLILSGGFDEKNLNVYDQQTLKSTEGFYPAVGFYGLGEIQYI